MNLLHFRRRWQRRINYLLRLILRNSQSQWLPPELIQPRLIQRRLKSLHQPRSNHLLLSELPSHPPLHIHPLLQPLPDPDLQHTTPYVHRPLCPTTNSVKRHINSQHRRHPSIPPNLMPASRSSPFQHSPPNHLLLRQLSQLLFTHQLYLFGQPIFIIHDTIIQQSKGKVKSEIKILLFFNVGYQTILRIFLTT